MRFEVTFNQLCMNSFKDFDEFDPFFFAHHNLHVMINKIVHNVLTIN
jgi:hypothetical protein